MNQSLIQIKQQRRIYSNHKIYSKPLPSCGFKRNTTLIQDGSVLKNERINKNLRIHTNTFGESSCYCDNCGKRSALMKKIFQLYRFPQTNQWKKQKQFRRFRRLINCVIFIMVNIKLIIIYFCIQRIQDFNEKNVFINPLYQIQNCEKNQNQKEIHYQKGQKYNQDFLIVKQKQNKVEQQLNKLSMNNNKKHQLFKMQQWN